MNVIFLSKYLIKTLKLDKNLLRLHCLCSDELQTHNLLISRRSFDFSIFSSLPIDLKVNEIHMEIKSCTSIHKFKVMDIISNKRILKNIASIFVGTLTSRWQLLRVQLCLSTSRLRTLEISFCLAVSLPGPHRPLTMAHGDIVPK